MKKIIIAVLVLLVVAGVVAAGVSAAQLIPDMIREEQGITPTAGRLDFEMLEQMYASGENIVLSPLSARLALSMAAEGAKGETRSQILALLEANSLTGAAPEEIESANAVFTLPQLELLSRYEIKLDKEYDAERFEIDGDVVENVNHWVQESTDGLIQELLKDAPAADTGMILINAVAMNGKWTKAFDPGNTHEATFHAAGGDVTVDMMRQLESFRYVQKDGCQMICLPFYQSNLEMWILLPEEGGMEAMLDRLAAGGMDYLRADAQHQMVHFYMPRTDVLSENVLNDTLRTLGVELAFTDTADFSGISKTPLKIDQVLQNARIRIDEEGTRAAAATAVMMKAYGAPNAEPPAEMRVDRPFAFVICDSESDAVCFSGVIENPGA